MARVAEELIPGVYMIRCKVNGKVYVGSSSRSVKTRKHSHFNLLKAKKHTCKQMQNDFDEFGESAFEFNVLEKVDNGNAAVREAFWINALDATSATNGYNASHSTLRGRPMKHDDDVVVIVSVSISKQRKEELKQRAKRLGLSVSEAIGRLIDDAEG